MKRISLAITVTLFGVLLIGSTGCDLLRKPKVPEEVIRRREIEKSLDELVVMPKYDSIAIERDPFLALAEGVRQKMRKKAKPTAHSPILAGILTSAQRYRCIIKFKTKTYYLYEGETFGQFTVERINPEGSVVLRENGETTIIRLGGKKK
jgi:hypothetical protein